jgi:hypothetical protein
MNMALDVFRTNFIMGIKIKGGGEIITYNLERSESKGQLGLALTWKINLILRVTKQNETSIHHTGKLYLFLSHFNHDLIYNH